MALFSDLDVLKEIPGYQAIMKGVVKSLIQILIEQLSAHTGEESVILTASVNDGSLSHLGSESGQNFLQENEEIKTKFLGFCLQRHHRKPTPESNPDPGTLNIQHGLPHKMSSGRKVAAHRRAGLTPSSPYSLNRQTSMSSVASPPYTEHTSVSTDNNSEQQSEYQVETDQKPDISQLQQTYVSEQSSETNVKLEPVDADDDLEITGVDIGGSLSQDGVSYDQWYQSQSDTSGYSAVTSEGAEMFGMGDQSAGGKNWRLSNEEGEQLKVGQGQTKGYACSMCQKVFVRNCERKRHESFHTKDYKHKHECQLCGRIFSQKSDLTRHTRVHTGEKPYKCSVCFKSFAVSVNLKSHQIVHLKERKH